MPFEIDYSVELDQSIFSDSTIILILVLMGLVFLLVLAVFIIRYFTHKKGSLEQAFKRKIIKVLVPKASDEEKNQGIPSIQQIQEKIGIAETLYATIAGMKAQTGLKTWFFSREDVLSLELVAQKGKIHFYITVPEHLLSYLEEQIHAQYSNAYIEEVDDYNVFSPQGIVGSKLIRFGKDYIFPIKTYKKFDSDPLNAVINALSKVEDDDGVAIQFVVRSARKEWHNKGAKVATKMQQGKKLEEALKEVNGGVLNMLGNIFSKPKKSDQPIDQYKLSPMEEEIVKGLEDKTSKAGVSANIRIIACSKNTVNVDRYLSNITNAFNQYDVYKYGNQFEVVKRKSKKVISNFIYRHFDESVSVILNTEELASLYHFPIPLVNETPNIDWLQSKKAPAPQNMSPDGVVLGVNEYRGKRVLIRADREDRRRHMYIIGMTGTGKSYFASGLAMQDIMNGEGVCFIDPHGDDLEEILARIPKERAEDVIIIDPADTERPVSLNMLEYENQDQMTFVVNEIMSIFDKLYDLKSTGGPMFEQYFKNACYLVMSHPESGSTLMEIPRVLADEDFRKLKLSKCKNQPVKDFWEKEAQKAGGEASLANMVPYITSKLAPFIANDIMRPIISQQKSSIDFADAMNNKKIVLVKLSKGKLGKINADLIGMIVIGKLLMAALSRGEIPAEQRKDFYLYIDEFQNFLTDSIEVILSEARKYKLCLIIGHQYIGQLVKGGDTKFKDAIFGNVGTKVAFRIGVDDSESLAKEFSPIFSEYDFLNVEKRSCFVKLLIDGANPPGFNMRTMPHDDLPVALKNEKLAKAIKELSRLKYGKERDLVEMEVNERIRRTS